MRPRLRLQSSRARSRVPQFVAGVLPLSEVDERLPGWEGRIGLLAAEAQARRHSRQGVAFLETRARRQGK